MVVMQMQFASSRAFEARRRPCTRRWHRMNHRLVEPTKKHPCLVDQPFVPGMEESLNRSAEGMFWRGLI